jgi:hypothetical protein
MMRFYPAIPYFILCTPKQVTQLPVLVFVYLSYTEFVQVYNSDYIHSYIFIVVLYVYSG